LSYPDCDGRRILEPGRFLLRAGTGEPAEFVLEGALRAGRLE